MHGHHNQTGVHPSLHLVTYDRDVTFRDDHDAALARAAALERELETARQATEERASELAAANAERARLAAEVEELRAKQPKRTAEKPAPSPADSGDRFLAARPDSLSPFVALVSLVVVILVVAFALWLT